ncbi:hypothetical protein EHW61_12765 [Salinivibrio sp. VYel6]|uniref:hypothetical protein n=1 Tax=Salinivibrio sp. VYel6 TaxID=2490493 RepID=UPI00128B2CC2|nr:hypothetical protein [Salinivibrio sp. VYel6]MPX97520.1 hypothetical protein [Salinivibrio sp. VYel6]
MSSQKETDTQLPPLLPLEYCTVERAARLLGCEVEDIYHWVTIGAIKLYARFNEQVVGKTRVLMTEIKGRETESPERYLAEVIEILTTLESELLKRITSPLAKAAFFLHKDAYIGELENSEYNYMDNTSHPMGVYHTYGEAYWKAESCTTSEWQFQAEAVVRGLWEVDFYADMSSEQLILWSDEIDSSWDDNLRSAEISIDKQLWDGEYYLVRNDLLKINKATHTGTELDSRYNSPDIAKKFNIQGSNGKVLFDKFKTSKDTRGIALGVLAKLIAQSKPNKLIRGGKVNASELVKMMDQECARLGIGSLSAEVRKDISQCVDVVDKAMESAQKTNKSKL